MIRAIWALLKVAIVVSLVIWVAEHPGTVSVDWMGHQHTIHIGYFLLIMLGVSVLGILIFSMVKTIIDLPKTFGRYRDFKNKDKGLKAIGLGLAAVAAGDAKAASYQAERAKMFLSADEPLPKLLEAQAARLKGDEVSATRAFVELMDNADVGFFGIRGLLQTALDNADYPTALELGHKALKLHPKQPWLLCVVYDLEVRLRHWEDARKVLYRAEKAGAIAVNKANSDRVAMLLAEAEQAKNDGREAVFFRLLNKAYKLDQHFIPTVLRLGRMYIERKKYKAAISIIKKAWQVRPHPGLVELWYQAYQPPKNNDSMARVRWFEKLAGFDENSVEGKQALAEALLQEGLWGEARKKLEEAEEIRPNVTLYKIWARLEERATHDDAMVRIWLEKAADAPKERVWICSETGRTYDEWVPISDQDLFNTIIWDFPQARTVSSMIGPVAQNQGGQNLLGAP